MLYSKECFTLYKNFSPLDGAFRLVALFKFSPIDIFYTFPFLGTGNSSLPVIGLPFPNCTENHEAKEDRKSIEEKLSTKAYQRIHPFGVHVEERDDGGCDYCLRELSRYRVAEVHS
jgi:hypothetical protein